MYFRVTYTESSRVDPIPISRADFPPDNLESRIQRSMIFFPSALSLDNFREFVPRKSDGVRFFRVATNFIIKERIVIDGILFTNF